MRNPLCSRIRLSHGAAAVLFAAAAALGVGVASPAEAAIAVSPDIMRGLCKKSGGTYVESPGGYHCSMPSGARVQCPKGAATSDQCQVRYQDGSKEPPLPGFPPKPEANAPDAPAGPPVKGSPLPPTGGVG